jgi:hypothetical protein
LASTLMRSFIVTPRSWLLCGYPKTHFTTGLAFHGRNKTILFDNEAYSLKHQ